VTNLVGCLLLHWQITGKAFPSGGGYSRKLSIPLQPFLAAIGDQRIVKHTLSGWEGENASVDGNW
jgi:hypothetical protein